MAAMLLIVSSLVALLMRRILCARGCGGRRPHGHRTYGSTYGRLAQAEEEAVWEAAPLTYNDVNHVCLGSPPRRGHVTVPTLSERPWSSPLRAARAERSTGLIGLDDDDHDDHDDHNDDMRRAAGDEPEHKQVYVRDWTR